MRTTLNQYFSRQMMHDLSKEVECLQKAAEVAERDVVTADDSVHRAGYTSLLGLCTATATCTYIALQAMAGLHAHASSKPSR